MESKPPAWLTKFDLKAAWQERFLTWRMHTGTYMDQYRTEPESLGGRYMRLFGTRLNMLPVRCNLHVLFLLAVTIFTGASNFAFGQTAGDILKSLGDGASPERRGKLIEGAKKEGRLIFYGTLGVDAAGPMLDLFRKSHPYIAIDHYRANEGLKKITTIKCFHSFSTTRSEVNPHESGETQHRRISDPRHHRAGLQRLLDTRYFTELRSGQLSRRRIQAWALQHYLYNLSISKGQVIVMMKYAHDTELYNAFAEKFAEEQHHPNLVKRFGFAMGLKEEDFTNARPTFENLLHMSVVLRNRYLGSPIETRVSGFANETILTRYSDEFDTYLRRHYGLDDQGCQFFTMHKVADEEHTRDAANYILRHCSTPENERMVREVAEWIVRLNIMKFGGMYDAYP
jgi:pyrroloquinoline quinone (PQQ) biosynthesis protein C